MSGIIFEEYLRTIWYTSMMSRTSYSLCMICDKCSPHGDELPKIEAVEYILLPPQVKYIYEPTDQGIIAAVKRHARRENLQQEISVMGNSEELRAFGKK